MRLELETINPATPYKNTLVTKQTRTFKEESK